MKRQDITRAIDRHLTALGFNRGTWLWSPGGNLTVIVGGRLKAKHFRAGISKRELTYHLGIMTGWSEMREAQPEEWVLPSPKGMNGRARPAPIEIPAMAAG